MSFTPTEEQQAVLDAFATGGNVVVTAAAGAGKTSTMRLLAEAHPTKRGLYGAFNKKAQLDAASAFPKSVSCKTSSALARQFIIQTWGSEAWDARMNAPRQNGRDQAAILGISGPHRISPDKVLAPQQVARIVMETVQRFAYSADPHVDRQHLAPVNGVETFEERSELAGLIVPLARKAWAEVSQPKGYLKFSFDHAMKLWGLSGQARLAFDYVIVDEAQDCQPAGTPVLTPRGEVKIEDLREGDLVVAYDNKSLALRTRGRRILSISSRPHDGHLIRIDTASGLSSRYTPEHIAVAKVANAFTGKHLVYLMRRGDSWRVGVTSAHHGVNRPSSGLAGRLSQEQADAAWVLAAYADKRNALMLEAEVAARFGIPQLRFQDKGQRTIGQERLDAFWLGMGDLTPKAAAALHEFGRDPRYPLATRRHEGRNGSRSGYLLYARPMNIRACNLMEGMEVLDVRPTLDRVRRRVTGDDEGWTAIKVRRESYVGDVWSMEVERNHTYVADGIVTHNCNPVWGKIVSQQPCQKVIVGDRYQQLYAWRGAVDAMDAFPADHRLTLTQSFRFGPAIADEANKWLSLLGAEFKVRGFDKIPSRLARLDQPKAVLTRTNAEAISNLMEYQAAGVRAGLVGGAEAIRKLAEAAEQLKETGNTWHPELCAFTSWGAVQDFVENDFGGGDLATFVKLIDQYGTRAVIAAADRSTPPELAEVVISTAHKAKGAEWQSVRIATDFPEPREDEDTGAPVVPPRPDMMLAYVAVTRAKEVLDREGLAWVDRFLGGGVKVGQAHPATTPPAPPTPSTAPVLIESSIDPGAAFAYTVTSADGRLLCGPTSNFMAARDVRDANPGSRLDSRAIQPIGA